MVSPGLGCDTLRASFRARFLEVLGALPQWPSNGELRLLVPGELHQAAQVGHCVLCVNGTPTLLFICSEY